MTPTFFLTTAADQVRESMASEPIMLTATSHYRIGQRRQKWQRSGEIPPIALPAHIPEVAVDAGGFEAGRKYCGSYPFTWQAYTNWLARMTPTPTWAAMPDLPCERELAADAEAVMARQQQTWLNAWHFVMARRHVPWAWVPTIQGRSVDEYVRFARQVQYQLLDLHRGDWQFFRQGLEHPSFRVGIGSLCKRARVGEIVEIVSAVADVLGRYGFRFHLWGVKLSAIEALRRAGLLDVIASLDSGAWNNRFGSDLEAPKLSNLTQREYCWQVAWPAYKAKLDAALAA